MIVRISARGHMWAELRPRAKGNKPQVKADVKSSPVTAEAPNIPLVEPEVSLG